MFFSTLSESNLLSLKILHVFEKNTTRYIHCGDHLSYFQDFKMKRIHLCKTFVPTYYTISFFSHIYKRYDR